MRNPIGPVVRSNSPKSRMAKADAPDAAYSRKGPIHELEELGKQIKIDLKHFRGVVSKNTLEMLPGNGTIVLDTIWHINLAVKSSVSAENSSSILSATNHMYQSAARLIKLCDDALIEGDKKEAALNVDNVKEVVQLVEDAVQTLISLAQEKISTQQTPYRNTPRCSYATLAEKPVQRNSLPDIPLTPREREILEQTSNVPGMVRSSHSTESILRDSSPPPKPPLPDGVIFSICHSEPASCVTPPPLPPKRRNRAYQPIDDCFSSENSLLGSSLERISFRSRSPEDSSSLLSESAGSLDSILNHSREEDEIKAIMEHSTETDTNLDNDISDVGTNGVCSCTWDDTNSHGSICNQSRDMPNHDFNRLSNTDSGIASLQSHRSSSYSKRSSQQSSASSQWNVLNSSKQNSHSEMVKSESMVQNVRSESRTTMKNSVHSFTQKMNSSSSTTVTNVTTNARDGVDEVDFVDENVPPAIPLKTRRKQDRQPSPYDNVPEGNIGGELLVTCQMHQSHQSLSSSSTSITSNINQDSKPPPLPPKKKHIMAYMEMFGNCSHTNDQEFLRNSVHVVQSHWTPPQPGIPATQSCSFSSSSYTSSHSSSHTQMRALSLPPHSTSVEHKSPSPLRSPNAAVTPQSTTPPALPPKQRVRTSSTKSSPPLTPTGVSIIGESKPIPSPHIKTLPDLLEHTAVENIAPRTPDNEKTENEETNPCDIDLMEELDVDKYLMWKSPDEDGPDIRGGTVDALIIQATKATKNGVFTYQEAFLTTYRTFITPHDLISKLIWRYNHFYYQPDKKPRSREAFALIVRVVSDLTVSDLDVRLQQKLMNFVHQLISCGELTLAKALRVKVLERHEAKELTLKSSNIISSLSLNSRNSTLLDFKSEHIAEQMTLLDADLFMKIEIPEVLIWAQEQNEERSPNLTTFTEHFNKMSYWARTRILNADTKDIREKYFLKFIKIMKHLRKINNFNSYLALLSALDSAPIRRLEWQKHVQEGLKEYCALIDSSSSFRAYRQALAETQPPCIPYIGLVLQDLTFVHIGNSDYLPDGKINFSKRWQQFNIVENMKRFKKCTYQFKKNDRIITFFENFNDYIGEDAMWQLSESIKPRGGKKTAQ